MESFEFFLIKLQKTSSKKSNKILFLIIIFLLLTMAFAINFECKCSRKLLIDWRNSITQLFGEKKVSPCLTPEIALLHMNFGVVWSDSPNHDGITLFYPSAREVTSRICLGCI